MSFLQVAQLLRHAGGRPVVNNISFQQEQGQNMGIAGATGSGKSTLLRMIAGLIQPEGGSVHFEGRRVRGPEEKLMPGHPGIAYLSQYFELPPHFRMEEVLRYENRLEEPEADRLFRLCRIDHLLQRKSSQLSGGEKQRIALARLLITAPRLLLLDEPWSNLDKIHKDLLKAVVNDLQAELGLSCLLVAHDPADILSWAHHVLVIREGKLVQEGPPEAVYRQPADAYVAGLLGDYTSINPEKAALIPGLIATGTRFLRPDTLEFCRPGEGTEARAVSVRFFGAYYEWTLEIGSLRLRVHCLHGGEAGTVWVRARK
ncbi:MAG TPA: ABC transporter ATP-binding protein [Chitinophagaceae bacterium]|nr:ABC transporter ATP-binding protein [Chitinophagaceae bacterium]